MPAIECEISDFKSLQIKAEEQVNEITKKVDAEIDMNHIPGLCRDVASI
jgi:hypothetical protein